MSTLDSIREHLHTLALSGAAPRTLQYAFVVNALLCALVLGPLLGAVGTMVVTKRLAFFSQAIGQAALTGVAIGILLNEPYTAPYVSMFAFCILVALAMNFVRNRSNVPSDTLIGVFLSISLAIGACLLLFVSTRVNTHIVENILFGSILTVNDTDIGVLLVVAVTIVMTGLPQYNQMMLTSLNASLARVRGVRVTFLDYAFVLIVTVLTVAAVKIIGAILVEALLVIPAATARIVARSIKGFFFWSVLFATLGCLLGILVPLEFEIPVPSGGAIILTCSVFFIAAVAVQTLHPWLRRASS